MQGRPAGRPYVSLLAALCKILTHYETIDLSGLTQHPKPIESNPTMARVRILPEILSNKIAAGEVVERPGSVVKELVENALDAGAGRVVVEAEKGGRSLIRVADDGCGMSRDDALLSIERHATSKIARTEDLFSIQTLGFRGEALPSIASVSRFKLVTRPVDEDIGTEITLEGGKLLNVVEAGAPAGTMITVRDLFFNTPARRKFLKTVSTELGHIGDTLARLALGRPDVDFKWLHNGRVVKRWPAVKNELERALDVLGQGLRPELFPMDLESNGIRVAGWAASPRVVRPNSKGIHLFVNNRFVRDRILHNAVFHGYRERLMKGQFPVIICRVLVPVDQVDVNVHPTKHEVRFADARKVRAVVAAAVKRALETGDRPGWQRSGSPRTPDAAVREPSSAFDSPMPGDQKGLSFPDSTRRSWRGRGFEQSPFPIHRPSDAAMPATRDGVAGKPTHTATNADRPEPGGRFADLRVIGQYRQTYILCESARSLVLIDQHAAHERVYYEQLKRRSASSNAASQRLLVPETIETGFEEAGRLERFRPGFSKLGLEVEPFGGNTVIVTAVPVLLSGGPVEPAIRELLDKLSENQDAELPAALDDCLKIMACHGAIRARQQLEEREIRRLLVQLDECDNPSHCPHGRPTWIEWSDRDIEKAFGRLV